MQRAVNSRIGRADNTRFLEHFRYIIVASQLLNEQTGPSSFRPFIAPSHELHGSQGPGEYKVATTSVTGAVVTGITAFGLVWLIHWSRNGKHGFSKSRFSLVVVAFVLVATILYTHARRQWLQYLRQQAVEAASTLITNLQAHDASASSALTLIQEVELVSRGYRM